MSTPSKRSAPTVADLVDTPDEDEERSLVPVDQEAEPEGDPVTYIVDGVEVDAWGKPVKATKK